MLCLKDSVIWITEKSILKYVVSSLHHENKHFFAQLAAVLKLSFFKIEVPPMHLTETEIYLKLNTINFWIPRVFQDSDLWIIENNYASIIEGYSVSFCFH